MFARSQNAARRFAQVRHVAEIGVYMESKCISWILISSIFMMLSFPCTHIIAQQQTDSSGSDRYTVFAGRVHIYFPCEPKHAELRAMHSSEPIQQYSASSNPDRTTYFLMCLEVTDTAGYKDEGDILSRGPRPELNIWNQSKTTSKILTRYRNHPCEEVQVNLAGGSAAALRMIIVIKNCVYTLLAIYPKDKVNQEMNNRFFNSFELIE